MSPLDAPLGFICKAENADMAEDFCMQNQPQADIVWGYRGNNQTDALEDYCNASEFEIRYDD
jgi:hypothetical protein